MSIIPPSPAQTATSNVVLITVVGLVIPLVVIVGLFVMMALHDISGEAGLGLIGGIVGLHGGATIATTTK